MPKYTQDKNYIYYKNTEIPKNKLNIRNQAILEARERMLLLKDYFLKPKEEFALKISFYMCELIALHPFFELNGRTIRLFFDMIAAYNGYEYIDYEDTLKMVGGDNKFIKA